MSLEACINSTCESITLSLCWPTVRSLSVNSIAGSTKDISLWSRKVDGPHWEMTVEFTPGEKRQCRPTH